jgi:hypothetical protein
MGMQATLPSIDRSSLSLSLRTTFKGKYLYALVLEIINEAGESRLTGINDGKLTWIFKAPGQAHGNFTYYVPGEWYDAPRGERIKSVYLIREDGKTLAKNVKCSVCAISSTAAIRALDLTQQDTVAAVVDPGLEVELTDKEAARYQPQIVLDAITGALPPKVQVEQQQADDTESYRRARQAQLNAEAGGRQLLEDLHGQVWSTDEVRAEFEVIGFAAPFVVVRRRIDNAKGSLEFQHSPRFYFGWQEDK